MIIVWGSIDLSTNFWLTKTASQWEECVDLCFTTDRCVVGYQSDGYCYLFYEGDIMKIKKETADSGIKVSMKVKTEEDCSAESTTYFPYYTDFGDVAVFGSLDFQIIESEDSYSFVYGINIMSTSCKDWLERVPECTEYCTPMMMTFQASISGSPPLTLLPNAGTLRECMILCFGIPTCYAVQMSGNSCHQVGIETFNSTVPGDSYVSLKLNFRSSDCPATWQNALDSFYEIANSEYSHFIITPSTGNPVPGAYDIELSKAIMGGVDQVERKSCSDEGAYTIADVPGCYMLFLDPADYETATTRCSQIGDILMPIPDENAAGRMISAFNSVFYEQSGNVNVGLRKIDGNWVWSNENLIKDQTGLVWAKNHPKANFECAYLACNTNEIFPYQLKSYDCADQADGYICHIPGNTF